MANRYSTVANRYSTVANRYVANRYCGESLHYRSYASVFNQSARSSIFIFNLSCTYFVIYLLIVLVCFCFYYLFYFVNLIFIFYIIIYCNLYILSIIQLVYPLFISFTAYAFI